MQKCRVVHVSLRFLKRRLHVPHIDIRIVAILLFLERHGAVDEVDPLHVLLLQRLVQHLELDFLALTTILLLVWKLHEIIHTFGLTVGLLVQYLEVIVVVYDLLKTCRFVLVLYLAAVLLYLAINEALLLLVDLHLLLSLLMEFIKWNYNKMLYYFIALIIFER